MDYQATFDCIEETSDTIAMALANLPFEYDEKTGAIVTAIPATRDSSPVVEVYTLTKLATRVVNAGAQSAVWLRAIKHMTGKSSAGREHVWSAAADYADDGVEAARLYLNAADAFAKNEAYWSGVQREWVANLTCNITALREFLRTIVAQRDANIEGAFAVMSGPEPGN